MRKTTEKAGKTKGVDTMYPTGYNEGVMTNDANSPEDNKMLAIESAKQLAATLGRTQFWTVQDETTGSYIVSDPVAQCAAAKGRYMVTDDAAIRMARAAGVQCDDEGKIG
jgi:hypothetical protein